MVKMFTRAGRATLLDKGAFTEAFFDNDAPADGAIIVASVGAITYLGLWAQRIVGISLTGLLGVLIASVASWLILAFATWFAATRLFGSSNRPQTMIGMHGLAALPLVLEMFRNSPLVAGLGLIWYLVVLVVATREASDLSLRNAGVSVLIGFAAAVVVRALIGVPFAVLGGLFG